MASLYMHIYCDYILYSTVCTPTSIHAYCDYTIQTAIQYAWWPHPHLYMHTVIIYYTDSNTVYMVATPTNSVQSDHVSIFSWWQWILDLWRWICSSNSWMASCKRGVIRGCGLNHNVHARVIRCVVSITKYMRVIRGCGLNHVLE